LVDYELYALKDDQMKKGMILLLAVGIMAGAAGCQKIKRIFVKPPPEGVVQESYPIKVYAYDSSVVIKAPPQKVIEYFVKDISVLEKASSMLQMEFKDLSPGIVTEVGKSIALDIKVLGINFPCRIINLKYKPDKELWLLALTDGNWILTRFELKPVPEGSIVNLNLIGQPSKTLAEIIDSLQFGEAAIGRIDHIMAFVQSEFDPELDVKKLTGKGLRGEAYETFLQAYEASVWINAPPEDVIPIVLEPDNIRDILKAMQIGEEGEECFLDPENRGKWETDEGGEPIFCRSTLNLGGFEWKMDTVTTMKPNDVQNFYTTYGVVARTVFRLKIVGQPEKGGARVRIILSFEPPGATTPKLMDSFIAISGLPQWMEKVLLKIKHKVEGVV
jgi:hypothetical protein